MLKPPCLASAMDRLVPETDCMHADTTGMFRLKRGSWFGSMADRGERRSTDSVSWFFRVSLGISRYSLKVREVSLIIVAIVNSIGWLQATVEADFFT